MLVYASGHKLQEAFGETFVRKIFKMISVQIDTIDYFFVTPFDKSMLESDKMKNFLEKLETFAHGRI